MSIREKHNNIIEKLIDFTVLSAIFYIVCQIIPTSIQENVILTSLVYAIVVVFSLHLCKNLVRSAFKSANSVIQLMLNYATGLLIGTCIMLIVGFILTSIEGLAIVAIIASIMAFFVLGTVSPLARPDKHISH